MIQKFKFGEIWIADLNPRIKTEMDKLRPVLVIQDQVLLDAKHPSTIVIPLTTNLINNTEPLRIRLKSLDDDTLEESDLAIDQIRAIDNQRLVKGPIMVCSEKVISKVHKAIFEIIGNV